MRYLYRLRLLLILLKPTLLAQEKSGGPFDRLLVTENLLDAIYPGLKDQRGLLVLRAQEFHAAIPGGEADIDLFLCHPGSGVPQMGHPFLPCQGFYPKGPSEFMSVHVSFSTKYPIREFGAGGSFIVGKSKPVEQEIIAHPEWNEQQMIDALRRANPRFGPNNRAEFLRTLPLEAIVRFTGCHLETESAAFDAYRLDQPKPDQSYAGIVWRISGHRDLPNNLPGEESCVARFEPFDGKLGSVNRM